MPLIEVKLYDRRINDEVVPKVIEKMTDAICDVIGDDIRDHTWVLVEGLSPKQWGIGRQADRRDAAGTDSRLGRGSLDRGARAEHGLVLEAPPDQLDRDRQPLEAASERHRERGRAREVERDRRPHRDARREGGAADPDLLGIVRRWTTGAVGQRRTS